MEVGDLRFLTLDDLIAELQRWRTEKGNIRVVIDDADTGNRMPIQSIDLDFRMPDVLLLTGEYDIEIKDDGKVVKHD